MKYTILGSKGFIGKEFVNYLEKKGHECFTPEIRKESLKGIDLGHVIYSAGVPNFMQRPYDAVDAHVCQLKNILENSNFESLVYFSGGRVYNKINSTKENDNLIFNPTDKDDLYGISKIMGESLCIASENPRVHILRLTNVTGNNFTSKLFLPSIIRDAINENKIKIFTTLSSKKDYVYIDDVLDLVPKILINGKEKVYNIASGKTIESEKLINKISKSTGCSVEVSSDPKEFLYPETSIIKIKKEFNFHPTNVVDKIEGMVKEFEIFFKK
ncbi:SDR family oxidoreductase [Nitrosopumilus sp.]|nr:SDR family oxidoreductase [Nitrosopumilus sp.]